MIPYGSNNSKLRKVVDPREKHGQLHIFIFVGPFVSGTRTYMKIPVRMSSFQNNYLEST